MSSDGWNQYFDLRSTWVDVENGREARSSEVRDAWREQGLDLIPNADPIELPADVADEICPRTGIFVFSITPDQLARWGGWISYMGVLFQSAESELWRLQRDRVLDCRASATQTTLSAVMDGGGG